MQVIQICWQGYVNALLGWWCWAYRNTCDPGDINLQLVSEVVDEEDEKDDGECEIDEEWEEHLGPEGGGGW